MLLGSGKRMLNSLGNPIVIIKGYIVAASMSPEPGTKDMEILAGDGKKLYNGRIQKLTRSPHQQLNGECPDLSI